MALGTSSELSAQRLDVDEIPGNLGILFTLYDKVDGRCWSNIDAVKASGELILIQNKLPLGAINGRYGIYIDLTAIGFRTEVNKTCVVSYKFEVSSHQHVDDFGISKIIIYSNMGVLVSSMSNNRQLLEMVDENMKVFAREYLRVRPERP